MEMDGGLYGRRQTLYQSAIRIVDVFKPITRLITSDNVLKPIRRPITRDKEPKIFQFGRW